MSQICKEINNRFKKFKKELNNIKYKINKSHMSALIVVLAITWEPHLKKLKKLKNLSKKKPNNIFKLKKEEKDRNNKNKRLLRLNWEQ